MVVTDLLVENFRDIFDMQYTARLEEELDEIEEGKLDWHDAMAEFYKQFAEGSQICRKAYGRTSSGWRSPPTRSAKNAASRW